MTETHGKGVVRMDGFRHEAKHEISYQDLLTLRMRLRAVMRPDAHAPGGKYQIRSLYFDTPEDKALREKLDGVNRREKFRIRCYNRDLSLIHLEKKSKIGDLSQKRSAVLEPGQVQAILRGESGWVSARGDPLLQELAVKMRTQRLRPRTIVDYTREAFTCAAGDVRVTLDYDIRTGLDCTDFLHPLLTVPAGSAPILLEVKWGAFLPSVIRDAVGLESRRTGAFSKYAQCRIYG